MVRITKLKMLLQPKEGAIIKVIGGNTLRQQWNDKEKVEQSKMEKITNGLGRAS